MERKKHLRIVAQCHVEAVYVVGVLRNAIRLPHQKVDQRVRQHVVPCFPDDGNRGFDFLLPALQEQLQSSVVLSAQAAETRPERGGGGSGVCTHRRQHILVHTQLNLPCDDDGLRANSQNRMSLRMSCRMDSHDKWKRSSVARWTRFTAAGENVRVD